MEVTKPTDALCNVRPSETKRKYHFFFLHRLSLWRPRFDYGYVQDRNVDGRIGTFCFLRLHQQSNLHRPYHQYIPTLANLRRTFQRNSCCGSHPLMIANHLPTISSCTIDAIRHYRQTKLHTGRFHVDHQQCVHRYGA